MKNKLCGLVKLRGDTDVVTDLGLPVASTMAVAVTKNVTHFIANSPSLRNLEIFEGFGRIRCGRLNPLGDFADVLDCFLHAAAVNGKIQKFILSPTVFRARSLAYYLQANRETLKSLDLNFRSNGEMMINGSDNEGDDNADVIANAVGELSTLEELDLHNFN